jgi:2-keto-4-pentenoate hydratase/2-oxohepta-3-ene-1,7-dioic acid hydratase in catechol pathway
MKFATIATENGPRACVLTDGKYVDLHAADPSLPTSLKALLALGEAGLSKAAAVAAQAGTVRFDPKTALHLAVIPDPQKIICLGLNYRDHAIESGMDIPPEPVLFSKYPSALIGHGSKIVLPAVSEQVDYEAELVIVVGRRARHVTQDEAMDYVAGFAVGHDVSARDWQLNKPGKQWMAGKTFDTFAPVGPVLVTRDEVPNPSALGIRLRLNGQTMQDSSTAQLIFDVPYTISYLSKIMTLEPGDLIFTGTPPGVGMARKPPVWMKPGDVVEVEIDGLGVLSNPVVAEG